MGTVNAMGLYAAPGIAPSPNIVSISATSIADPSKSGTAQITITTPPGSPNAPTITSISPVQGRPGDVITISGTNFGTLLQTVVFSGPDGISIPIFVNQGSPTSLTVQVPLQTVSEPLFVQVPLGGGSFSNSNSVPFVRLPDLRIRAPQIDLGAGESESFQVAFFGTSTPQVVAWTANQGSITSAGTYTAPGSLEDRKSVV